MTCITMLTIMCGISQKSLLFHHGLVFSFRHGYKYLVPEFQARTWLQESRKQGVNPGAGASEHSTWAGLAKYSVTVNYTYCCICNHGMLRGSYR